MKVDLHLHTRYSPDCNSSLRIIIDQCRKLEIGCVAITDHNTIDGALAVKELAPFPVIVSEEIMSQDGEIIGYFLKESIPGNLPPEEVMARIKDQGGLVCLPHPFDGFGRFPLEPSKRESLVSQIDIIEVFNARSLSTRYSEKARAFAEQHGMLMSAGSDAHAPREVGKAYVEMQSFEGPQDFLTSLSKGAIYGKQNGVVNHVLTTLGTLPKRLRNH